MTGVAYTRGGGLILTPWPPPVHNRTRELWVLAHDGVVHHYVPERKGAAS